MGRISAGISQIGGKFRLLSTILKYIPYHEFYLEPFLGAAWVLLNKPRCRYECGNDLNSELINYLLVIREYPKEFDQLKQGVFGLVSQEICNRIVRGELVPRNNIERAYFYYYLNKLTFGGGIWMVRKNPPYKGIQPHASNMKEIEEAKESFEIKTKGYGYMIDNHNLSREGYGRVDSKVVEHAKKEYEIKTKGFGGLVNPRALPQTTLHDEDFEKIKAQYKGLQPLRPTIADKDGTIKRAKAQYSGMLNNFALGTLKEKQVDEAKVNFRGVVPKNAQYGGLIDCGNSGGSGYGKIPRKRDIHIYEKSYKQAQNKGINPKSTRPFTNNDCGLLTPLNPNAIKRLRYVNLTTYPFQKVYKMFYKAFHERKGLGPECFVYFDPPYPGSEKHYKSGFDKNDHDNLITIIKESPFHCLLSIGGECEFYLKDLSDLIQIPVKVKYSTDANSQAESQEYLIMNYDINELPKMEFDIDQQTIEAFF